MSYKGPRYMPGTYLGYKDTWDGLDARTKYMLRTAVSGLPIVGPMFQAYDNMRYMDDYTRNRGVGYDKVLYPSRTSGAQGFGSAVSFVSNNINRLYQEDKRAKRRVSSNRRRYRAYY